MNNVKTNYCKNAQEFCELMGWPIGTKISQSEDPSGAPKGVITLMGFKNDQAIFNPDRYGGVTFNMDSHNYTLISLPDGYVAPETERWVPFNPEDPKEIVKPGDLYLIDGKWKVINSGLVEECKITWASIYDKFDVKPNICKRPNPNYVTKEERAHRAKVEAEAKKVSEYVPGDFKVGDKVKVLRAAESGEKGWQNTWPDRMESAIGGIGTINHVHGKYGITIQFEGREDISGYQYPAFVLEKIKDEPKVETKVETKPAQFNRNSPVAYKTAEEFCKANGWCIGDVITNNFSTPGFTATIIGFEGVRVLVCTNNGEETRFGMNSNVWSLVNKKKDFNSYSSSDGTKSAYAFCDENGWGLEDTLRYFNSYNEYELVTIKKFSNGYMISENDKCWNMDCGRWELKEKGCAKVTKETKPKLVNVVTEGVKNAKELCDKMGWTIGDTLIRTDAFGTKLQMQITGFHSTGEMLSDCKVGMYWTMDWSDTHWELLKKGEAPKVEIPTEVYYIVTDNEAKVTIGDWVKIKAEHKCGGYQWVQINDKDMALGTFYRVHNHVLLVHRKADAIDQKTGKAYMNLPIKTNIQIGDRWTDSEGRVIYWTQNYDSPEYFEWRQKPQREVKPATRD